MVPVALSPIGLVVPVSNQAQPASQPTSLRPSFPQTIEFIKSIAFVSEFLFKTMEFIDTIVFLSDLLFKSMEFILSICFASFFNLRIAKV